MRIINNKKYKIKNINFEKNQNNKINNNMVCLF
jgi:hypothetical protein